MKTSNKTALEFKREVLAYLDKMAKAYIEQPQTKRSIERGAAFENAASYIRQMETHKTAIQ